jgi:hypothetical protein
MEVLIVPSIVAVKGPGRDNNMHHHHALHIVVGLRDGFEVTVDKSSLKSRVAIVAPDAPHRLHTSECLLILLEPKSSLAIDIRERWLGGNSVTDLTDMLPRNACGVIQDRVLNKETLTEFFRPCLPSNFSERIWNQE